LNAKKNLAALVLVMSAAWCGTGHASTYNVDIALGPDTLTGQITTNCDSCLLVPSHVVSFNFTEDGSATFSGNASSVFFASTSVLEVAGGTITYFPSAINNCNCDLVFENATFTDQVDFNGGVNQNGSGGSTDFNSIVYDIDGNFGSQHESTSLVVATLAPVPLPSSAWLMLCGLGGLGFLMNKRQAAKE
jgi:hypothetical protein